MHLHNYGTSHSNLELISQMCAILFCPSFSTCLCPPLPLFFPNGTIINELAAALPNQFILFGPFPDFHPSVRLPPFFTFSILRHKIDSQVTYFNSQLSQRRNHLGISRTGHGGTRSQSVVAIYPIFLNFLGKEIDSCIFRTKYLNIFCSKNRKELPINWVSATRTGISKYQF